MYYQNSEYQIYDLSKAIAIYDERDIIFAEFNTGQHKLEQFEKESDFETFLKWLFKVMQRTDFATYTDFKSSCTGNYFTINAKEVQNGN